MHMQRALLRPRSVRRAPSACRWTALLLLCLSIALSGCVRIPRSTGPSRTLQQKVNFSNDQIVRALRAEINMGAGEITVTSGDAGAFIGDFEIGALARSPEVTYSASYGEGVLLVRQSSADESASTDRWALSFGGDVPLDLDLTLGAGRARLELQDLPLSGVRIAAGAGEVYADLSGPRDGDFYADIKGGIGHLTVVLPAQVGVVVDARGGIGSIQAPAFAQRGTIYTNDRYGTSDVTIHVSVDAGIGVIELKLR